MSTLIVEVCTVDRIDLHPNAERLAIASIKGWQSVIQLGQFVVGEKCVTTVRHKC